MEFLNLRDEGANDSELAARKEIFDSCAEVMQHQKRHFRDDEGGDEVWTKSSTIAEGVEDAREIYKLWPSEHTFKQIIDSYFTVPSTVANQNSLLHPAAKDDLSEEEKKSAMTGMPGLGFQRNGGGDSDGGAGGEEGFDMSQVALFPLKSIQKPE